MTWRRFSMTFLLTCAIALGALYALILVIDPYDALAFPPDWERYPVSRHSRDYNAVLARRSQYDSAVIGNSTSMLLHPDELNGQFGGRAARVLGAVPNTRVLDFMIPSPITTEDSNFVDAQHYTAAVASDLARLLYAGATDPDGNASEYRILPRSGSNE